MDYDERVRATAAYRLAILLKELGVLSDYAYCEFLYPGEDRLREAETLQN